MYKKILIVLLLINFAICIGCSKKDIEQSMLIGKYVAVGYETNKNLKVNWTETLEIKPDGTYTYYYRSYDGKEERRNTNKWEFKELSVSGKKMVIFSGFISYWPENPTSATLLRCWLI